MSKDNVKKMFGKMEKDADMQKKYAALMLAHQNETEKLLSDKLVELGKTAGFAFSKDDLLAARAELVDIINSNKELSDKDLSDVAGGKGNRHAMVTILAANNCAASTVTRTGCTDKFF
jgi:predicted ribosomally synthesized peptide with nif11-like leader